MVIERSDSLPAAKREFRGVSACERGRRKPAHPRNPGELALELRGAERGKLKLDTDQ